MRALVAIALLAPAAAFGQAKPQPVTKIDLGVEQVEGGRQGPDGVTVVHDREPPHTSLIHLRDNFADRVLGSSKELH